MNDPDEFQQTAALKQLWQEGMANWVTMNPEHVRKLFPIHVYAGLFQNSTGLKKLSVAKGSASRTAATRSHPVRCCVASDIPMTTVVYLAAQMCEIARVDATVLADFMTYIIALTRRPDLMMTMSRFYRDVNDRCIHFTLSYIPDQNGYLYHLTCAYSCSAAGNALMYHAYKKAHAAL